MDGTLAGIFLIASLGDMALNDCPTECLAKTDVSGGLTLQVSAVEFNGEIIGQEVGIGYDFDQRRGPFQPAALATITDKGRIWIGAGARYSFAITDDISFEASLMPGYDSGGRGPNLGGNLQFRSSLGLGLDLPQGGRLSVSYDHRSNADIHAVNPGLETISVRYSMAFD